MKTEEEKKIRKLVMQIYYDRTGLDFTEEDHERNIKRCMGYVSQFKKDICKEQNEKN